MITGEPGILTEVFKTSRTKTTMATGRIKPGHSNSISFIKSGSLLTTPFYDPHHLMARDEGKFDIRKFSFDGVKICMADSRNFNANENILRARLRDRKIHKLQRVLIDRSKLFQYHGFHGTTSLLTIKII